MILYNINKWLLIVHIKILANFYLTIILEEKNYSIGLLVGSFIYCFKVLLKHIFS